jgi:hypothetical protein
VPPVTGNAVCPGITAAPGGGIATTEPAKTRRRRALAWEWSQIEDGLTARFLTTLHVGSGLKKIEASVQRGEPPFTLGTVTLLFLLDNNG